MCLLISDNCQRTLKFFCALAAGVSCVSHLWIHDCCSTVRWSCITSLFSSEQLTALLYICLLSDSLCCSADTAVLIELLLLLLLLLFCDAFWSFNLTLLQSTRNNLIIIIVMSVLNLVCVRSVCSGNCGFIEAFEVRLWSWSIEVSSNQC